MPQNDSKKLIAKKSGKAVAKKGGSGKKSAEDVKRENRRSFWAQIIPYLLFVFSVVLIVCFITGNKENPGIVVDFIYKSLTGLFGGMAFSIPLFIFIAAAMQFGDFGQAFLGSRLIYAFVTVGLGATFLELIAKSGTFNVLELYDLGTKTVGGGVIGGLLGEAMLFCFKDVASFIIVVALFLLFVVLMLGFTPKYIYLWASYKVAERREKRALEEVNELEPEEKPRKSKKEKIQNDIVTGQQIEIEIPKVPLSEDEDVVLANPTNRKHVPEIDIPVDDNPEVPAADEPEGEVVEPADEFHEETEEERKERQNSVLYEEIMERSKSGKSAEQLKAERAVFGEGEPEFTFDGDDEPEQTVIPETEEAGNKSKGNSVLDKFADDFEKGKTGAVIEKAKEVEKVKRRYVFPRIDLLSEDRNKKNENIKEELHETADKLVTVLQSFKVNTEVTGVSRGPTITRYELVPKQGVRVKQILNLLDDISLALATTGVRIEAPIPGKSAIGVEVPNKTANTVYLRELIASKEFQEAESKITACLGKDVAGNPIIFDIKKMPHLLIAGATGMGKSVCINSILVSILYKATPDEVKLILIDPKKVEFVPYNGLPQLLVPVVTDPKKAAGTLQWAVNEMERRYALIEAAGRRDIKGYNSTVSDPEAVLPQIVIVIDELADLMATASSEVETSISRIAAKARAAGMHLIIGTQRPSVDVITGVIKANIPSRIACTVASQTDSRTIIDRAGAENLIGRGDMLYNPVGVSKPIRVQGAFVSTEELDDIVDYIKEHNKSDDEDIYDEEVIREIDKQAQTIGNKKGAASGGDDSEEGDADPLAAKALDIAVTDGKISTSLLQRKLSIGYGRAAKIIDWMEAKGYVSAPEGQKPRDVLITREQYDEMRLREETIE